MRWQRFVRVRVLEILNPRPVDPTYAAKECLALGEGDHGMGGVDTCHTWDDIKIGCDLGQHDLNIIQTNFSG